MIPLFRSVYEKLAALLLVLFVSFGAMNGVVSLLTARAFVKEVNQRVNKDLATQLAAHRDLTRGGRLDLAAARQLFEVVMTINPLAEVYVLGADGTILAPAPSAQVKRTRVALAPIERMLAGEALPIVGDDPRDPGGQRVFSVARLDRLGYLYVILGGQQFESLMGMLLQSQMLRWGAWVAAGSLAFGAIAGLFLLNVSTRRIRTLTAAMQTFRQAGYTGSGMALARASKYEDEIDRLGVTFEEMAWRIHGQMEQLQQTDAARRELFANVSHDLRTPLASLHGYLETLTVKREQLTPAEQQQYLDVASRRSEQLTKLVSELFELAKLESHDTRLAAEPLSACDLVQDVAQKHRLAADSKAVAIIVELRGTAALIEGDVSLLERMLDNLLENAVRFSPSGAEVHIECGGDTEWASIKVLDSGPGIPPHELGHIFERFYRGRQTPPTTEGGGLGLAIAKRIVELHGGHIKVANRPVAGAVFEVSIPTNRSAAKPPQLPTQGATRVRVAADVRPRPND